MTLRDDLREVWSLGGMTLTTLLKRIYVELSNDDVWGHAAQLAYYFLFSLFPFFIFLTALLAYVPIPDLLPQIMSLIGGLVPAAAWEMVEENMSELVSEPRGGLLSFGILLALWVSSSAMVAIADGLNRAYGVKESRPFWKIRLQAMSLTIGLAVLIVISMTLLIFGPELGHWLAEYAGAGPAFDILWSVVRWPVIVFLMTFAIALIYYFMPDVEQEWRWVTPGSAFAVLMWIAMSLGFRVYVDNFGQYDRTYGSIGAVIVLLTWMYLSGVTLLVGGEINAEIEHAAAGGKNKGEKKMPSHNPSRSPAAT